MMHKGGSPVRARWAVCFIHALGRPGTGPRRYVGCAHLTGRLSCSGGGAGTDVLWLWWPAGRGLPWDLPGALCVLVRSHPSSVIDLMRAPGYFLFFRDGHRRDDSQAKLSKSGFLFQIKERDKETLLKWWAGVGRRGKEVTGVLDTEVEMGCWAWSSAEQGRWLTGGVQAA